MASSYRYLNVEFISHTDIKQPNMTEKKKFFEVYSPEKIQTCTKTRYLSGFKI